MLLQGLCTAIVGAVFLSMCFSYTDKRAQRKYASGRQAAPSIKSFNLISKGLFLFSMIVTLISYWVSSPILIRLHQAPLLQLVGAVLILFGFLSLTKAFNALGENYSPLFDAYLPKKLITNGAYKNIRHPIYLYNLFVSFGLAISSGVLWVAMAALVGLGFILNAISIEERYLYQHFPDYKTYSAKSWKLIPRIY